MDDGLPVLRIAISPALCFSCIAHALAILALRPALSAPRSEPEACRSSALRSDRLSAAGIRGELVLASGARAVLAGVHWPETAAEDDAARAWLSRFDTRALTVSARGEDDRWGRSRIEAVADPLDDADEPIDLAGGLVSAGLAVVDAGESDALCRPDLLVLEAAARDRALGLWQSGSVRDARDGTALSALVGRFVIARGRVLNVGERSARTYLDFARRGADGLTVTVPKRTWRMLQERGLTAQAFRGRVVQVRGIVELRNGPILDIASADMIEVEGFGGSEADGKGEPAHAR